MPTDVRTPLNDNYSTLSLTPLTPHIGAEVHGVDLNDVSDAQFEEIERAWADWMVLVFRDQAIDKAAHKAFGRRFGELHVHPLNHARSGDDEILEVKTTAQSKYTAGDGWHTDVTCDAFPPMASMLYMHEVPEVGGGDTLYADMYLAYEMLSPAMQTFLEDKVAVHDGAIPYVGAYGVAPPTGQDYPRNEHPVICRHPVTGRRLLYVNAGFTSHIKGLKPKESRAILDMLFALIAGTPSLTCRVRWEPQTLTLWDNRCTQHHAVWDYYPHTRWAQRVSIVAPERPAA
ncbi:MAG: TauD/TfdA family dioxygenase [Pseudomonadales bacterium]|jgi:taurine dioxygenase|nr:TauD/TfdA family dioxygenase [Pseudomonadales bacterium]